MFRTATGSAPRGGAPDRNFAVESYRQLAASYDATCGRIERPRRAAIDLLGLRPGDVVLDVACGSGKSLPHLAHRVGPQGRVVGIDQSPEMIALARGVIRDHALTNVDLVEGPLEEAALPQAFDAFLFCYTHDVLRTPAALANLFGAARPGARVVSLGVKLYPVWLAPLNFWVRRRVWGYLSTVDGLERPWEPLAEYAPDVKVVRTYFAGSGYIACGQVRDLMSAPPAAP